MDQLPVLTRHELWQADQVAAGMADKARARAMVRDTVACPTCGAAVGRTCRTVSGKRADTLHAARRQLAV